MGFGWFLWLIMFVQYVNVDKEIPVLNCWHSPFNFFFFFNLKEAINCVVGFGSSREKKKKRLVESSSKKLKRPTKIKAILTVFDFNDSSAQIFGTIRIVLCTNTSWHQAEVAIYIYYIATSTLKNTRLWTQYVLCFWQCIFEK